MRGAKPALEPSGGRPAPGHVANGPKHEIDPILAQLVKHPVLDLLALDQSGILQNFHMVGHCGLFELDLFRDEAHANPIIEQVPIHLRREMAFGICQPVKDAQAVLMRQGPQAARC